MNPTKTIKSDLYEKNGTIKPTSGTTNLTPHRNKQLPRKNRQVIERPTNLLWSTLPRQILQKPQQIASKQSETYYKAARHDTTDTQFSNEPLRIYQLPPTPKRATSKKRKEAQNIPSHSPIPARV